MLGLALRLRRLEHLRYIERQQERCAECGHLPNGRLPQDGSVRLAVCLPGYDPEPEHSDWCTLCGSRRTFRLSFDSPDNICEASIRD